MNLILEKFNSGDYQVYNLEVDLLIYEIALSYLSSENIYEHIKKQFIIDFPRMKIFLNDQICEDIGFFLQFIKKYETYKHNICQNFFYVLLMLITQASFYYAFRILYDSTVDERFALIAGDDFPTVALYEKEDYLDLLFSKNFFYVEIETNRRIRTYQTRIMCRFQIYQYPSKYINQIKCLLYFENPS